MTFSGVGVVLRFLILVFLIVSVEMLFAMKNKVVDWKDSVSTLLDESGYKFEDKFFIDDEGLIQKIRNHPGLNLR